MSDLIQRVADAIAAHHLLDRRARVLVAVSGGLDSIVLLDVLARLAPDRGWRLAVAHFNHQLRGRSSDADERLVRRTARRLGLRCVTGRGDVRRHADRRGLSIEMAARELRHRFLARAARRARAPVLALAHHADDQVELFFLRLLRGSGAQALAGMKWRNPAPADPAITLIRPLLGETKSDLQQHAARYRLEFREDATNADPDFDRNRIRHELLPLLEARFQPALRRIILRQMDILGAEADWVTVLAREWLAARPRPALRVLPVAVQRRALQLQANAAAVPLSFEMIEQLRSEPGARVSVAPGLLASCNDHGLVTFRKDHEPGFKSARLEADITSASGALTFDGVKVTWRRLPSQSGTFRAPLPAVNAECFDADKVGPKVVLRHWRPGDRFQPIGMDRDVKLQDLFTNARVPRARRRELLVAGTAAGEIFWVERLRVADRFKLDEHSRRRLKWRWKRL